MLSLQDEIQIDNIINAIKQEVYQNEIGLKRYLGNVIDRFKKQNKRSQYLFLKDILENEFSKEEGYLDSILKEKNMAIDYEQEKYILTFLPIFIGNNQQKNIKINKDYFNFNPNDIVFDYPIQFNQFVFINTLNPENIIDKNSNKNDFIFFDDLKNNHCFLIPILRKNYQEDINNIFSVDNQDYYFSAYNEFILNFSDLNEVQEVFFSKEKLKYNFTDIIKQIGVDKASVNIEVNEDINELLILFYDLELNSKLPINIMEVNCNNWRDLNHYTYIIEDLIKEHKIQTKKRF